MIKSAYRDDAVWGAIENANTQLESFSKDEKDDPRYLEFLDKLAYTKWLLETSNSAYFSANDLQSINNQLNSVHQHLANNANNWQYYEHVSNAFAEIFKILPYPRIKKIFRSEANDAIEEITGKISILKAELSETIGDTEAKIEAEVTKLKSFVGDEIKSAKTDFEEIKTEQAELQKSLSGVQDEISALDTKMQTQFEVWDADNRSQIAERLSELSETFSDAQAKRSDEFQDLKNAFSSSLVNLNDSIKTVHKENAENQKVAKKALQQSQEEYEAQAKEVLDNINGFYEKAGQTVLSGDFLSSGVAESRSFGRYSIIAAFFIIASAGILGWMWFSLAKSEEFQFSELAMRVPVSIIFLFPGLYFASLANQHRKSAIKLRSLGLRIKAFDAYLVNADDPQKKELRKQLATVFFVDSPTEKEAKTGILGHHGKNVDQMVQVVDKLVDKLPPSSN